MSTCLLTLQLEVSRRLLPLIRLQRWVCFLSPLSPTCLPPPLVLSVSRPSPSFWFQRPEGCIIQASPSGSATDHLFLFALVCVTSFPQLSFFLPSSYLLTAPDKEQSCSWSTLPAGGWEPYDFLPLTSFSSSSHASENWPTSYPPCITSTQHMPKQQQTCLRVHHSNNHIKQPYSTSLRGNAISL